MNTDRLKIIVFYSDTDDRMVWIAKEQINSDVVKRFFLRIDGGVSFGENSPGNRKDLGDTFSCPIVYKR